MQKKADEVVRSPHLVQYSMESKIQNHFTHPDVTHSLIGYVEMSYGASPEKVEAIEAIRIDPGGSMFTDEKSPPIVIFVDGINVEVKLEHMDSAIYMIKNRKPLINAPKFSKIYMAYGIAVLPEASWEKIIEEIYKNSTEALESKRKMRQVYEESEGFYSPEPESDIKASIIIKNLIKLADSLDVRGCDDEADAIDSIINIRSSRRII